MPLPIISVAQMRAWEQSTWATGQTETAVIARVGEIVARRALAATRPGDRLLILAGKGHNGDDACQAAPGLRERQVKLINVSDPVASLDDIQRALAEDVALVLDGLFGIGLNRPLDHGWRQLLAAINAAGRPILAIDNPSGLNVETGHPEGEALRATVTLTLGAPKHGLFHPEALPFVGRLEVAPEIGLGPCPFGGEDLLWTLPRDFAGFPPPRPSAGHKGTYGHLGILAGSLGYHGAAVLAARGAQRARPGLITVHPQEGVYAPVAAQLQAVMVRPFDAARSLTGFTALLVGPGLAAPTAEAMMARVVQQIWCQATTPVVADASALDWLPRGGTVPAGALRVITPHPGEAARLLGCAVAAVQADRPSALRRLSARFGDCWVALKGHQTLVGRSQGDITINSSGNPGLAQGGSGDLLAGYLAGLLAQPALADEPGRTIRYAVWRHGEAADQLEAERTNWIIEDLADRLGR